jgi:uridine kinase
MSAAGPLDRILAAARAAPPRAGATAVLAIDGRSGAGKSTLAQALTLALDAPIVALEHLYGGWDGLENGVSLLLNEVLRPLADGNEARVPHYDWLTAAWSEPWLLVPPAQLIVEGAGAGARSLTPYTSVLVWLEADAADRRERVRLRDAKADVHWQRWARQEDAYFARDRPADRADLVIASGGVGERG